MGKHRRATTALSDVHGKLQYCVTYEYDRCALREQTFKLCGVIVIKPQGAGVAPNDNLIEVTIFIEEQQLFISYASKKCFFLEMPSLTIEFVFVSLLIQTFPFVSAQFAKEKKIPKTKGGKSTQSLDETPNPYVPPVAKPTTLPSTLNNRWSPSPTQPPNTSSSSHLKTGKPSQKITRSPASQTQSLSAQPTFIKVHNTGKPTSQSHTSSIPPTIRKISTKNPSSLLSLSDVSIQPTITIKQSNIPSPSVSKSQSPNKLITSIPGISLPSSLKITSKPSPPKASSVQNATSTETVVTTTVQVPEFSLLLFFGVSPKRRLLGTGDMITQSFTGDSILTSQVQMFLTRTFQNMTPSLTYFRIVSTNNGSTIYAVIQPNLTIGKQWITANYSGYSSFQGLTSKLPTSDDLGTSILNAFSPAYGQATFLTALHSSDNVFLQQVTEVRVALLNRPSTIQLGPNNTTKDTSILAGTVIASAVCLMFVSAIVFLLHRNHKERRKNKIRELFGGGGGCDKVSLGCNSRSSPPLYISIPCSDRNNITSDMTSSETTNIFDVAMVNTTCWKVMSESSNHANQVYSFQSIKAPSGGSKGSSSLEQILEESSCNDSVPAMTNSFEVANTFQNISFNSDDAAFEDSGENWDRFYMNALQSSTENKADGGEGSSSSCSMSLPAISPSSTQQLWMDSPAMSTSSNPV